MEALTLADHQEAELLRLLRFYRKEAGRCRNAKAYLAGCVMAGAELETVLILMVNIYPDEAAATNQVPRSRKANKPLVDWNLGELLRVAKVAGWLPSALNYGRDDWNRKTAKIGDYAEVVREIRNLAHPARYMEDHAKKRVTKRHLAWVFDTIDVGNSWLFARVEKSLLEHMKAEGWVPKPKNRHPGSKKTSDSRRAPAQRQVHE